MQWKLVFIDFDSMRPVVLAFLASVCVSSVASAVELSVVQFNKAGQVATGLSLARNLTTWCILGSDGEIHYIEGREALNAVKLIEGQFTPTSVTELRSALVREFGPTFEVIATKHFLVVQPVGRGQRWPQTFEQLHLQFTDQLRRMGVNVRTGKFIMVAVVLPDRAALHAELDRRGIARGSIAGIYINNCNRVYTYDSGNNAFTAAILRHEAAHQSAFNSNIHSRLNDTPKWISEGLGMLFEAPGMATGRTSTMLQRVHRDAIRKLQEAYADPQRSFVQDMSRLIADDSLFANKADVEHAYNLSWLMMFYLSERRSSAFAEILNHTASRPPFETYTPESRVQDFRRLTGLTQEQFAIEAARFLETFAASNKP